MLMYSWFRVIGYGDPALEVTTIILECSSPNLVLIGPTTTTCIGNGEWEPEPREVMCIGESYLPIESSMLFYTNLLAL